MRHSNLFNTKLQFFIAMHKCIPRTVYASFSLSLSFSSVSWSQKRIISAAHKSMSADRTRGRASKQTQATVERHQDAGAGVGGGGGGRTWRFHTWNSERSFIVGRQRTYKDSGPRSFILSSATIASPTPSSVFLNVFVDIWNSLVHNPYYTLIRCN